MIWKTSKPEDQLVMTPILGSKKKQLNFRLNMEFWKRLVDLYLHLTQKFLELWFYLQRITFNKQTYVKVMPRDRRTTSWGHPMFYSPLLSFQLPPNSRAMQVGSFCYPPRRCIVPGVLRQLQMKLWWRTRGRVLLGIPGKFVGGDWFTTAAQKMQIPFVRSLEVLLGP